MREYIARIFGQYFNVDTAADGAEALGSIAKGSDRARPPVVLITGSLHLAGTALADNGQVPS